MQLFKVQYILYQVWEKYFVWCLRRCRRSRCFRTRWFHESLQWNKFRHSKHTFCLKYDLKSVEMRHFSCRNILIEAEIMWIFQNFCVFLHFCSFLLFAIITDAFVHIFVKSNEDTADIVLLAGKPISQLNILADKTLFCVAFLEFSFIILLLLSFSSLFSFLFSVPIIFKVVCCYLHCASSRYLWIFNTSSAVDNIYGSNATNATNATNIATIFTADTDADAAAVRFTWRCTNLSVRR